MAHSPRELLTEKKSSSRVLGPQELSPVRKASTPTIKMPPLPHAAEVKVSGRDSYQKVLESP